MREKVISWSGAFLLLCCVGFWTMVMVWRGDVPLLGPSVIAKQPQEEQVSPETASEEVESESDVQDEDSYDDVEIGDAEIENGDSELGDDGESAESDMVIAEEVHEKNYPSPQWKFVSVREKVTKTNISITVDGEEVEVGTYDGWCEEVSKQELETQEGALTAAYCQSLKERIIFLLSNVNDVRSLLMLRQGAAEPEVLREW